MDLSTLSDCTVYIDEAGDLGFNRGTQWFVLSAVIVDKEKENHVRNTMAGIKRRLNIREIHMRDVKDFNKRTLIVKMLSNEEFCYANVIADTSKLNLIMSASSDTAYNYMCRMLLERVSWFLRDNNKKADIVLSARGTSRDGELIEYIKERLIPYETNHIDKNVFEKIKAKKAAEWDMLQLADVCATTMFWTHEKNGWGFRIPCFSKVFQDHLYRHNRRVDSYGIKYFDSAMKPDRSVLECDWPCCK